MKWVVVSAPGAAIEVRICKMTDAEKALLCCGPDAAKALENVARYAIARRRRLLYREAKARALAQFGRALARLGKKLCNPIRSR